MCMYRCLFDVAYLLFHLVLATYMHMSYNKHMCVHVSKLAVLYIWFTER